MQLHFTGRNLEVTPALKTYTEDKFKRLEKRDETVTNVNVVFHLENVTHIAEATLHVNGAEIHASAKASDMYVAIDELIDKLVAQTTKLKEKNSERR